MALGAGRTKGEHERFFKKKIVDRQEVQQLFSLRQAADALTLLSQLALSTDSDTTVRLAGALIGRG